MQTLGNKCHEEKLRKLEGQMAKLIASMNIKGYDKKVSSLCCNNSSTILGWDW